MSTISNKTVTQTVTLGVGGYPTYSSPLTIVSDGAVITASGPGVYGGGAGQWQVLNQGTINAPAAGTSGGGITLGGDNNNVTNGVSGASTAYISGASNGIFIGSGTITNFGTIKGNEGAYILGNNTKMTSVVNSGTSALLYGKSGNGLEIRTGISNTRNEGSIFGRSHGVYIGGGSAGAQAGNLSNYGTIQGYFGAISMQTTTGQIVNAGLIESSQKSFAVAGININAINGTVLNQSTGVIVALDGIQTGGTVAILNHGSITASRYGVSNATSTIVNYNSALIAGSKYGIRNAAAAGSINNYGTVLSDAGKAIFFQQGGLVTNQTGGLISGFNGGVVSQLGGGTVFNFGTITEGVFGSTVFNGDVGSSNALIKSVKNRSGVENSSRLTNFGTVVGKYRGFLSIAGAGSGTATVTNAASGVIIGGTAGIEIAQAAGIISNYGSMGSTYGNGIGILFDIVPQGNPVKLGSTVTNSGRINGSVYSVKFGLYDDSLILKAGYSFQGGISGGGGNNVLELAGNKATPLTVDYNGLHITNFQKVLFDGSGYDTLRVANVSGTLGVVVSGFNVSSDVIDLTQIGTNGTIAGQSAAQLTISGSGGTVILQLDASDGTNFTTVSDGSNGTNLSIACFCRGTLILTDRGEVAVQDLAIGDRLVTCEGAAKPLRWIGWRSYVGWLAAGNPKVMPVCFKPGSLADGVPRRELWLSPEHAIYLDGVLVPAELLANGSSIVKAEAVDEVHYFHLELEEHDVILAEGAWAESFVDDDSRGMFHNAAEYRALYPGAPLHAPAKYCAPRVEDGFELESLRRRLAGRARRLQPDGTAAAPAPLEGHLDLVRHDRIEGWARDPERPEAPVALLVLANGAEIGRVVADHYRPDLAAAGMGDGCHAFELVVPGGLAAAWQHTIEVCRADNWTLLPGSPVVLQPTADSIRGEQLDNFAA